MAEGGGEEKQEVGTLRVRQKWEDIMFSFIKQYKYLISCFNLRAFLPRPAPWIFTFAPPRRFSSLPRPAEKFAAPSIPGEKRETRKLNLCLVSFCEKLGSQLLIGLSFRISFRSVVYSLGSSFIFLVYSKIPIVASTHSFSPLCCLSVLTRVNFEMLSSIICWSFSAISWEELLSPRSQLLPPTSLQSQNRQKCWCRIVRNVDTESSKMLMQNRQKCWCRIVKNVDAVMKIHTWWHFRDPEKVFLNQPLCCILQLCVLVHPPPSPRCFPVWPELSRVKVCQWFRHFRK